MLSDRRLRVAVFSVVMIVCATAANAVMDALWSRYDRSVFAAAEGWRGWLDPRISWRNKWKDGDAEHGEAFPLSSTTLVFFTDGWHLAKTVTIVCLLLAILAPFTLIFDLRWPWWVVIFAGLDLLYGFVFEGLFAHLLIR